jgi:hypothetical protein
MSHSGFLIVPFRVRLCSSKSYKNDSKKNEKQSQLTETDSSPSSTPSSTPSFIKIKSILIDTSLHGYGNASRCWSGR